MLKRLSDLPLASNLLEHRCVENALDFGRSLQVQSLLSMMPPSLLNTLIGYCIKGIKGPELLSIGSHIRHSGWQPLLPNLHLHALDVHGRQTLRQS